MSSSYQLCPAYQYEDGYIVIRRVEKAYPVFLRCAAAYFPARGAAVQAMLGVAELCPTLSEFSTAAARLVSHPMLQPFEGGVPVLIYVARPGKEELFKEFAEGLDQADGQTLLKSLPSTGAPMTLVFGEAGVSIGQPAAESTAQDPTETLMHMPVTGPADEAPIAVLSDPEDQPGYAGASDDALNLTPAVEPMPAVEPDFLPAPEDALRPSVEVLMSTTTALNDLLNPSQPVPARSDPSDPQSEPPAGGPADPLAEPALEILLRQSPRLQAPELEFGPPLTTSMEGGRGPSPEEVLTAVRQVAGALDEAMRRQASENQTALQTVLQTAADQNRALEVRQAELWERQQLALRQMHADQANAIQDAIVRLDEERAAWQQRALRELQQTSAQQLPAALQQLQEEQAARQQRAHNQLRDDLLSRQPAAPAAPAAPAGALASDTELQNLNWQLEKSAVSSQDLRQRVGQLLWVNLLLLAVLIALAIGAFWLLRDVLTPAPAAAATVAATFTAEPPTAVPATPVPPTAVPNTATPPSTATRAATAMPLFVAALTCASADRPRNFYDCELTNGAAVSDTLALAVQAVGDELNGFNPLVMNDELRRIEPNADTGLFPIGALAAGETRAVRVMLPCRLAAGCAETTFAITPLVDDGQTIVTDQIINVTTHYFPPEVGVTP